MLLLHDFCLSYDCLFAQILVSLRGFLLRAVYVEARVHCGCFHGGSFLWRSGRDRLHAWYEEEDFPLCPRHPHSSPQHLPRCGALWNPCRPLYAWGGLKWWRCWILFGILPRSFAVFVYTEGQKSKQLTAFCNSAILTHSDEPKHSCVCTRLYEHICLNNLIIPFKSWPWF